MQTGSGVYHEEETVGDHTEFFQIWFAPYLQEALGREPTYAQHQHEDFPIENMDGYAVKTIIGHGAPVAIEAEAKMCDIQIDEEHEYSGNLGFERTLAVMVVSGKGVLLEKNNGEENILCENQFLIIHAHDEGEFIVKAESGQSLRIVTI